jgi:hypothetical protein
MLMAQYLPTFASSINDAGKDQGVVFHAHRNIQPLTSNISEYHRWRTHWVLALDIPKGTAGAAPSAWRHGRCS